MSKLGQFILRALDHPNEWTFDRYRAIHKSSLHLWIASGPLFLAVENGPDNLGRFERYRIWRAVSNCYAEKLENTP